MKYLSRTITSFLIIGLVVSCQEGKKEEPVAVSSQRAGSARRACLNVVNYGFIKPDSDYGYNGDGCTSYYVHRGTTRSFKVKMSNTGGTAQNITLRIDHPDGTLLSYSVASYTGGSISFGSPVPGTSNGAYIRWTATSVPAFTTYELTFNISGAAPGSSGSENGLTLHIESPCPQSPLDPSNCDADDVMHVILAD